MRSLTSTVFTVLFSLLALAISYVTSSSFQTVLIYMTTPLVIITTVEVFKLTYRLNIVAVATAKLIKQSEGN